MRTLLQRERRDQGFTIPELLVVMAIIGILAAIAIPTFFGAKRNGWNSQAHSALRSALSAERTYYIDWQKFTSNASDLRQIESNINWSTTDADAQGVMAAVQTVAPATEPNVTVLVSTSKTGYKYCIMNIAQDLSTAVNGQQLAGTYYARSSSTVTTPPTSVTIGECGSSGYDRSDDAWKS